MTDLAQSEPTELEAKAAFETESRIKETVRRIRMGWLELAGDLYKFNDLEMWRDLNYSSFEQWLASPEIELSRRQVYYLLEAHRELVVRRDVTPAMLEGVEAAKIQEVLAAIRRGHVSVEDALADCRTLTRDDLRDRYAKLGASPQAGGTGAADPLDATTEPEYAICPSCGSRYRKKAA